MQVRSQLENPGGNVFQPLYQPTIEIGDFSNILHSVLVGFQYQTFTHGSSQYQS